MRAIRDLSVNQVLREEKKRIFLQELADAYKDQETDSEFHQEIADWDITVGDGLDA